MSNNGTGGLGEATRLIGKIGPLIGIAVIVTVLAIALLSKAGCANHHTPPGFEGYIRSKPLVGAGEYIGLQRGPTSTGWVWRKDVVNIDMRPRTYSQSMSIRTAQGSDLTFKAHVRIRVKEGGAKDIVEKLGGPRWYELNVLKTFERTVREKVQPIEPFAVKAQVREIAEDVLAVLQSEYEGRPIEFLSVDIGNIQYPETIMESVIKKFVTLQENERKSIELAIAEKQIAIAVAEAQGTADAQRVISKTLDPLLLQYEALRAIEQLAGSSNTTFLLVPMTEGGTSPLILNLQQPASIEGDKDKGKGAAPTAQAADSAAKAAKKQGSDNK